MIVAFYVLYVLTTTVNFAWNWLAIALVMQFLAFLAYIQRDYGYKNGNRNYWEGE